MRQDVDRAAAHAIVMGGSMAGLLAARVLSTQVRHVTLIERDHLPTCAESRRGVPQGRHTHGLLASGRQVLDDLFPGFSEDAVAAGAIPGDVLHDARWFFEGGDLARPACGLDGLLATRPLLEHLVRSRVRRIPNVTFLDGVQVTGLAAPDPSRIRGVLLDSGEALAADLVVDATGRGSRSPLWLRALGYGMPAEDRVEIDLGYTTRFFRREAHHLDGDLIAITPPTPTGKCGGVMLAQEGGRWTVTLTSHFVPLAPGDLDGFIAFAAELPSRDIHDVIRQAEPIGDAVTSRFPASLRRRYERLTRFPEGYVVVGDGICSFNPIYGQGMSVAALESLGLGEVVSGGLHDVGRRFFRKAATIVDTPWTTAVGNDLRMPEAIGPRPPAIGLTNAYIAALQRTAHEDEVLAATFMRVANLLAPPSALLAPRIALRVFRGALRRRFGRTLTPARESRAAPS